MRILTAFDAVCLCVTLILLFHLEDTHLASYLESDESFAISLKGHCAIELLSDFSINYPFLEYPCRNLAVDDMESWCAAWCIVGMYILC